MNKLDPYLGMFLMNDVPCDLSDFESLVFDDENPWLLDDGLDSNEMEVN